MIFQNNVLKQYLKNVYFITGTPCGGKTTISRQLAKRHNLMLYDVDEKFLQHQRLSEVAFQPAMNQQFKNADEFFGRTTAQYKKWLLDSTQEQLDFVLLDLICLAQNQIVLCDCHLTLQQANCLTQNSHIVFLIKQPINLVEDYCNRPDHQDFNRFINGASNIQNAKDTCNATLKSINLNRYHQIKSSKYFWLERDANSTVEETVRKVEKHFCF